MENERASSLSLTIGFLFCMLILTIGIIFPIFFSGIMHFSLRSFPIMFFIPIFFVIFISITASIRRKRQQQYFTSANTVQQPKPSVYTQLPYNQKEEALPTVKNLDVYCMYCGSKISKNSIYCSQCGTKINY